MDQCLRNRDEIMLARLIEMLELARLLAIEPDSKTTLAKILVPQELLKKGYSVGRALASIRLGWKSYYKYAPLIYNDPVIFLPIPKKFLRDFTIIGLDLKGIRVAFYEVAKHVALEIVWRKTINGRNRRGNAGKEWLRTAKDLMMTWIREVSTSWFRQVHRYYGIT